MKLDTALDWSAWNVQANPVTEQVSAPGTGGDPAQGFAKAVEMCNNNGHCRKFDAGTMCPSYRVTRDEEHSTRGRANTLRLAVSGQLGTDFATEAVREALALCVSCKGCKRDCPTGVDMAKMKIEFAYHWQKKHGLTLKDRLVATMPKWAPWAARFPFVANLRDALPGAARLSERIAGLSAQRTLPQWRGDTFLSSKAAKAAAVDAPDVVLLVDTFNNYHEPENAHAALRVLQAAGYRVAVARAAASDAERDRPLCCGRTYLGAGLVDEAKREARRMVEALAPHVAAGATDRRARAVVPAVAARRVPRDGPGRRGGEAVGARADDRGVPGARGEGGRLQAAAAARCRRSARSCTATATRRRSTSCRPSSRC